MWENEDGVENVDGRDRRRMTLGVGTNPTACNTFAGGCVEGFVDDFVQPSTALVRVHVLAAGVAAAAGLALRDLEVYPCVAGVRRCSCSS